MSDPAPHPAPDGSPDSLERSLREDWDARLVDYDTERYPFGALVLEELRRLGHRLESLDRLHEAVPRERVYGLSKRLCERTGEAPFRKLVQAFVADEIAPRGGLVPPIAVQRLLNVRIMLPDKPQGVFPFHTGLLYGHGDAARSLWLPLTDVSRSSSRSASLQIIDLERSRELVRFALQRKLSIEEMTTLFGDASRGIEAGPGQVLFFTQEHIHGNFVNRTGRTRVSIDFRVAEGRFGSRLARKTPGGYFELSSRPREESSAGGSGANGKPYVIYLNNNTSMTREVPPHLQRLMVCEYCDKNGLEYDFELFELEGMDHLPTLQHLIAKLDCNVLMYSMYALPESREARHAIYAAALEAGVQLHFANESTALADAWGRDEIEAYLAFAKYGQDLG